MQPRVYFDSASTTHPNKEVVETYTKLLMTHYANSESLYEEGTAIFGMLEKSRQAIAKLLRVQSQEVIFTSGASEANSQAILGLALRSNKKHIVTSTIEHSSVLNCLHDLETHHGFKITYIPVNQQGTCQVQDVIDAIQEDTLLVTMMYVNNEVGSILPIEKIAEYVRTKTHAYMHVDLTQAIGKLPIDLTNIDLASFSAHKIYGLKGSGCLIKKQYVSLSPIIFGGTQEFGLRGGTSNAITNIVLAKTLRLSLEKQKSHQEHDRLLRKELLSGLKCIDQIVINSPEDGVASIVNFSCPSIPSEVMQNALNAKGFMVSARSTCESKSNNPSHVLLAMGKGNLLANTCIRVSFSEENTLGDVQRFIQSLKEIINVHGTL